MTLELRGDIPGLLRRTSPVYGVYTAHITDTPSAASPRFRGVVMEAPDLDGCVVICEDKPWVSMAPWAKDTVLDMADPTGRLHARLWLAERGHPTEEDRAEVLAWSVLSVLRGGRVLPVADRWVGHCRGTMRRPLGGNYHISLVTDGGWWVGPDHGHTPGGDWKVAADAALLRLGWALTNADGTLTLPPLPGAA